MPGQVKYVCLFGAVLGAAILSALYTVLTSAPLAVCTKNGGMGMGLNGVKRGALAAMVLVAVLGNVGAGPLPLNEDKIAAERFGADAPWYRDNIPFFASSDPLIDQIYYYRWQIFRAHQRDLGARGYISTEFLDDVSWQLNPWASLNDATGFHIAEGRWLRNRRYAGDYIDFMYEVGNDRHFSEAIAAAAYDRYLVDGDKIAVLKNLAAMKKLYAAWDDHFDEKMGLYWVEPIADATEYTISSIDASGGKDGFLRGFAFRPTINSYMIANARAISALSKLAGDEAEARIYADKAETLRKVMITKLWNAKTRHFIDLYKEDNAFVKYGEPIRGRELAGYLLWTYGVAPDDAPRSAAWKYLLDPEGLAGPYGLRTVGPSYEYYMRQYRYDQATGIRECQWNGPVWPFQTTQTLTAMANLLNDYHQAVVTRTDYVRLLRQYAALHLKDGQPDLEEDYDPATGKAIVGLPRSHHYFHSGFNDLIISGLAGIRPRADDVLEINPLIPADGRDPQAVSYFALQGVPYHGHLIGVIYDANGTQYGYGKGLTLVVDGAVAAHADTLRQLIVPVSSKSVAPVVRPIDLAMNLVPDQAPKGEASINADPKIVHKALDGRVWFWPEIANGWDVPKGAGAQWFAVDFGKDVSVTAAELSFFGGDGYAAPSSYRLEILSGGKWVPVTTHAAPIAGGVNTDSFTPVKTTKLRVVFDTPADKAMRLIELKAF